MRWTEQGIEYEADSRHVEILLQQLGLEQESKSLVTPAMKDYTPQQGAELDKKQATLYLAGPWQNHAPRIC